MKYGLVCCAVWIVYLLEPLPHVAALDRITYPIADSVALIIMGLMLGWLFGQSKCSAGWQKTAFPVLPVLTVTVCFFAGRMIQYLIFDTYSSFDEKTLETVLWCLLTGIAISCVMVWLNLHISNGNRIKRAMILGCLLFGMDLILFNFFMPLVFSTDIPDLVLRTFVDILTVTLGCLVFSDTHDLDKSPGNLFTYRQVS